MYHADPSDTEQTNTAARRRNKPIQQLKRLNEPICRKEGRVLRESKKTKKGENQQTSAQANKLGVSR